ncbi:hypothetical protein A4R29_08420 [Mesorhizobium ciceri biovar biserrulae]|nr:hypothetical protein A4R29_08420 [Mesorhizobium ciceri biovar biserrulae]
MTVNFDIAAPITFAPAERRRLSAVLADLRVTWLVETTINVPSASRLRIGASERPTTGGASMMTRSKRLPRLVKINAIFGDESRSAGFGGIVPDVSTVTLGYFVGLKMPGRSASTEFVDNVDVDVALAGHRRLQKRSYSSFQTTRFSHLISTRRRNRMVSSSCPTG